MQSSPLIPLNPLTAPGPARQPHHDLHPEDAPPLRVREAPQGDRVGRVRHRGPHEWHSATSKIPLLAFAELLLLVSPNLT